MSTDKQPAIPDERGPQPVPPREVPQNVPQESVKTRAVRFGSQHKLTIVLGLLIVIALGVGAYLYFRAYESTDDAQIAGHLTSISPRISGTILNVNPVVQENAYVRAGTVLAEIDPADYQAELDRAEADAERLNASAIAALAEVSVTISQSSGRLDAANAAVTEGENAVEVSRAKVLAAQEAVRQAEAVYKRAEADRVRYSRLLERQEISRSEYDGRETEAIAAQATWNAAQANLLALQKETVEHISKLAGKKADVFAARSAPYEQRSAREKARASSADARRAEAVVKTAQLNLSYSRIIAPVSGIIAKKTVEVGQRVQPGQQLVVIVPINDVWVIANFKETQLCHITKGQKVKIHVDAFDREYRGTVTDIGGATGSEISLLPAENATGNYVKVVQRLPVRIDFDSGENTDHRLRPGMSVKSTVSVQ